MAVLSRGPAGGVLANKCNPHSACNEDDAEDVQEYRQPELDLERSFLCLVTEDLLSQKSAGPAKPPTASRECRVFSGTRLPFFLACRLSQPYAKKLIGLITASMANQI